MNDELNQSNWQEQSVKEMIQKNEEMGEILKHQLDIIEYENAVDSDLVAFENDSLLSENKCKNAKFEIGKVNQKQAKEIEQLVEFEVSNYTHVLTSETVRHIENRHGKNGTHDKSMQNPQDLARIGYVVNNYDNVQLSQDRDKQYYNPDRTTAKCVIYSKRVNGTVVVVEAVPNSKKEEMYIKTMYKFNAKEKTAEKQLSIEEENEPHVPKPYANVRNELTTSSITSIPQPQKKVNTKIKNNNKDIER